VYHYSRQYVDSGWGCGYRNIQMLCGYLLQQDPAYAAALFGGRGFVPDIGEGMARTGGLDCCSLVASNCPCLPTLCLHAPAPTSPLLLHASRTSHPILHHSLTAGVAGVGLGRRV
jgi:hypothetical protein